MCTSLSVFLSPDGRHRLFGRNLDLEDHFGEAVTITPRSFPLPFRRLPSVSEHYAIIGMAAMADGYPLYADAMNERGLCMAGLNFPHNAVYTQPDEIEGGARAIAPFELIPFLLGTCSTMAEAKAALKTLVISDIHFSTTIFNTPLHWHLTAADGGLIIEATAEGLRLYPDRVGVLTNNPPYPYHTAHLCRYDGLSAQSPRLQRAPDLSPGDTYDLGLGLVGLPGDYTSPARFVRCATLRRLTDWQGLSHDGATLQFFRVLDSVAPPAGCVRTPHGDIHTTLYTCCMDTETLTYHVRGTDMAGLVTRSVVLDEAACVGQKPLVV